MRTTLPCYLPKAKPTTPNHNNLSSFLAHAARTGLSRDSTVYKGIHYEYTVQSALFRLGFRLERVGEKGDRGVDLRGRWLLPGHGVVRGCEGEEGAEGLNEVKVLVQCKGFSSKGSKTMPAMIRELEGSFGAAPREWFEAAESGSPERVDGGGAAPSIIALLVTSANATKGIREALGRSRFPLAFAKISIGGAVEQLLWNRRAAGLGLEGMNVIVRHRLVDDNGDSDGEADVRSERDEGDIEGEIEGTADRLEKNQNAAVVEKEVALEFEGVIWAPMLYDDHERQA